MQCNAVYNRSYMDGTIDFGVGLEVMRVPAFVIIQTMICNNTSYERQEVHVRNYESHPCRLQSLIPTKTLLQ